jgi:hypothetical protein
MCAPQQPPPAAPDRHAWGPRRDRMNWALVDSIRVDRIWESGDLNAVMHYVTKYLVNANITKEDLPKFGDPGPLHGFLLLQLGVDYLLAETQRLEGSGADAERGREAYDEQIRQFRQNLAAGKAKIAEQDRLIAELGEQCRKVHADAKRDYLAMTECVAQVQAARKGRTPTDESEEPGAIRTVALGTLGGDDDEEF